MKILIACEFSATVREAFKLKGHEAWSCDILPTEIPGLHYHGNVEDILYDKWDMIIAFPPCTHLAVSGARYFAQKRADGRQQQGIDFFMQFVNVDCQKVVIENPIGIMSTIYRKPDQIIQPYEYGHSESKKTCLWLKGLPKLIPTKIMEPVWRKNPDGTDYRDKNGKGSRYSEQHYNPQAWAKIRWANQTPSGQNKLGPSPDRAKIRSITYQGIADAMVDQWSNPP